MIINLPKNFTYEAPKVQGYGYAYVDSSRNKLVIKGNISYSRLINLIMYELNSIDVCPYCGKKLKDKKITIDHIIPRDRGGPSIPENLILCCNECNEKKGNMNREEYEKYCSLKTKKEKVEYKMSLEKMWAKTKFEKGSDIPKEWMINPRDVDIILSINFREEFRKSKEYQKVKRKYRKYRKLIYPVIIDRNNVLLDGFYTLIYSKENEIYDVPVIRLDNVEKKL